MAFNEKEQAVIKWGLENGKTKQEVTDAITKLRTGSTGISPERTQPIAQEKPSQMSRLGTDLLNRAKNVGSQIKEIGDAEGAVETVAQAAQTPLRVVGQAAGAVGDVIGAGVNAIDSATGGNINKLGEYIASTETGKQLGASLLKLQQEQPELAAGLGDLFNIATVGVGGTAAKPVAKVIRTGARNAINATSDIVKYVPDNLGQKAVDLISSDPSAKVETILKRSTPEEVDNFLKIAAQSSVSGESKSVFETVGDKLFDTTKVLQTKLSEIGKAKSDIMQPLRAGFDSFKKETAPFIQKLTSLKNSFTEIDAASKSKVQAIINDAKNVVTKQDADVLIDKVQDALYKGGIDMTIPKGSALDKQLRGILGEFNNSLKASLPKEYGQLNARYAQLIDSLDTINRSLGEVVEGVPVRGASLIKQYFSPAGSKAKEIFEFIKNETGGQVDLAKDATLAKFAGELYDDANVSSLLGGLKSVPTTVGGIATKLVEKLGSGRVTEAMRASTVRKAKAVTPVIPKKKVNYERAKGLSPENTAIETKAFDKITANEAGLLAEYKRIHGKEINTDSFRPLFKDEGYNGANAAAVQEPSSHLAKLAFADALKNEGEFAIFSAGGSGVGKSFGIKSIPQISKLKDEAAVILDSNLSNYDSAIKKIKQAESAGKIFSGVYTYRDPINALVNGVIKRMKSNLDEMGRIVPTKVIADNHINSLKVTKRLIDEGYDFNIIDNSFEGGSAKLSSLKEIEAKAKYPSVKELTDIMNKKIKELYDRGELTPEQYKEYVN